MSTLSPELREFVLSRFSSSEQIDVFVLLYRSPERRRSTREVATTLGMAPESAGMRLFLLNSVSLLASAGSRETEYWYASSPNLDQLAKAVSEAHEHDRAALATLVAGAVQATPARLFADAFRWRKP